MKIAIGSTLKSLRQKHGLSQKHVAQYLLVSRPTYNRFERDCVEIPFSKLCALADLYQLDPIEFIGQIIGQNRPSPSGRPALDQRGAWLPLPGHDVARHGNGLATVSSAQMAAEIHQSSIPSKSTTVHSPCPE